MARPGRQQLRTFAVAAAVEAATEGVKARVLNPADAPKEAHGFVLEKQQFVAEYDSHLLIYRHKKTGGCCVLRCECMQSVGCGRAAVRYAA